ncbi:MAG: hypothetical protein ACOYN4_20355 [Bacteroidales bacterium]
MKTSKFTSALATLSLVIFMSTGSIANSNMISSGDLLKSGNKNLSETNSFEKDFSYLRFDVSKFANENEETVLASTSFDYLRFDVNNFIAETEMSELPVNNEFEYLRFDANNFTATDSLIELPVSGFDYLRFDVNNFAGNNSINDLPEAE